MSSLSEMSRLGTVTKFDPIKGFGFARAAGEKIFFHRRQYRCVNPNKEDAANPLLIGTRPDNDPEIGTKIVFWINPEAQIVDGKSPDASDWTYLPVWNQGRCPELSNAKQEVAEPAETPMTEAELMAQLIALEGLQPPEESQQQE